MNGEDKIAKKQKWIEEYEKRNEELKRNYNPNKY